MRRCCHKLYTVGTNQRVYFDGGGQRTLPGLLVSAGTPSTVGCEGGGCHVQKRPRRGAVAMAINMLRVSGYKAKQENRGRRRAYPVTCCDVGDDDGECAEGGGETASGTAMERRRGWDGLTGSSCAAARRRLVVRHSHMCLWGSRWWGVEVRVSRLLRRRLRHATTKMNNYASGADVRSGVDVAVVACTVGTPVLDTRQSRRDGNRRASAY